MPNFIHIEKAELHHTQTPRLTGYHRSKLYLQMLPMSHYVLLILDAKAAHRQ
jgi:hypothetical protein